MTPTTTFAIDATITERGQTTVPAPIRRLLGVSKGAITFRLMSDGRIVIEPKQEEVHEDPAIGAFLAFLAADIARGNLVATDPGLLDEIDRVTDGVDVDLDAALPDA